MHFNGMSPEKLMDRASPSTRCIVVGDAECKHDEFAAARKVYPKARIMVLNDSARGMGDLHNDFVATMHCAVNNFIDTPRMPLQRIPTNAVVCGYECNGDQHARVDLVLSAEPIWGTCALFGVLCAFYMGFERVTLVGCPLHGAYGGGTKLDPWREWAPYFKGRVEVASGALRPILEEV